jgi:hypothetical protein
MNITARKLLSIALAAAFVLMAVAVSVGMSVTGAMADEPGIKTVVFGVT